MHPSLPIATSKALECLPRGRDPLIRGFDGQAGRFADHSRIMVERGITMKRCVRFVATGALGLLFSGAALADTLELKDGRVLQGRYLGGTQAVLRFELDGNVQAFSVNDVVALTFTHGSNAAAAPNYTPNPASAPVAAPAPVAQSMAP